MNLAISQKNLFFLRVKSRAVTVSIRYPSRLGDMIAEVDSDKPDKQVGKALMTPSWSNPCKGLEQGLKQAIS